ncbi:hypothetical protein R3P38DRAFT_2804241 [Favolaschia claudopus]|uniref:Chromo domain-containing protein n=1 Tax=Favolaschia claudopus TaxID=2862362 RepID=A0AAV9ZQI4_9AGAR
MNGFWKTFTPETRKQGQPLVPSNESFEVEAIRDARKSQRSKNILQYRVKWKNYPESRNTWISHNEMGNATALVRQFWLRQLEEEPVSGSGQVITVHSLVAVTPAFVEWYNVLSNNYGVVFHPRCLPFFLFDPQFEQLFNSILGV